MPTSDQALIEVLAELERRTKGDPTGFFSDLARRAVDEVLDGPRTGRWDIAQLEKTEATYVGTKVEIMVRSDLGLDRGVHLDLVVAGHEVDVKWSKSSGFMIPTEAVGHLCLCIGGLRRLTRLQVGLVRCSSANLNLGKNKDGKVSLNAVGRAAMVRLVDDAPFPPNFVADMEPSLREEVTSQRTIQGRINALAEACPYTPIHRSAICTIARTPGDPARRLRRDTKRPDTPNVMRWLSAKYGKDEVAALGLPPLGKDEWIAVPQRDISAAVGHG